MKRYLRLGVNIDHVATIRNARGGWHPDPVRAARLAAQSGADGITAHLREDRRHISDEDIRRLSDEIDLPLNLEMAATQEMLDIALRHRPHATCIVPERREERTTEGGLDVAGNREHLRPIVTALGEAGIRVSLFVEPDPGNWMRRLASGRLSSNCIRAPIAMPRVRAGWPSWDAFVPRRLTPRRSAWNAMPVMA